jgi:hypothetical protein
MPMQQMPPMQQNPMQMQQMPPMQQNPMQMQQMPPMQQNPMQMQQMQMQQMQQMQMQQMQMGMMGGIMPGMMAAAKVETPFQTTRSLQVGGLSPEVNDYLLHMLLSSIGQVSACKVLYDKVTGYHTGQGFADMVDRESAKKAIEQFNGRAIYGSTITMNFVAIKAAAPINTNGHHCCFVGNIDDQIDDQALHTHFIDKYPSCSSARIARQGACRRLRRGRCCHIYASFRSFLYMESL